MSSRLITFLAALSLIVIAGVSGWTIRTLLRAESAATSPYVVARLGQTRLVYEAAYARSTAARQGGVIDALDLAARFPDFAGAGADFHSKPESIVFLDLEPATEGDAPEDRMARLYARFLESEPWSNPGGLIMRRFMPDSPYAGEELYFAPPEGRVFTARCTRPAQPPDAALESCLYDVRVGPIDAHVRFRPELIGDWEALSNGARALVQRIQR